MDESPLFNVVASMDLQKGVIMANAIESKALEVADVVAEKLGFFVVDAEYKKEGNDRYLRLFIDTPSGVGLNECEEFSRAFEKEFDKIDPIKEAYILEVSSPGVERKLKTEREFLHYIGKKVSVKLYKAIDSKKEFVGILKMYEDKVVTVLADDKEIKIPLNEAVYIKLYFEI